LPEEGIEPGLLMPQASGDTISPTPTVENAFKIIHYVHIVLILITYVKSLRLTTSAIWLMAVRLFEEK
jgi:hypothetical protein